MQFVPTPTFIFKAFCISFLNRASSSLLPLLIDCPNQHLINVNSLTKFRYAVLSYVAQEAVQRFGSVTAGEMLDELGMEETTPEPLIQVVQFAGFLGAYRSPGDLNPYMAATMAAVLTHG